MPTSCSTSYFFRITFRKVSLISAQSTTSTRIGRFDSENASFMALIVLSSSGFSVMTAKSRSEWAFAVPVTRDPKAHTGNPGRCWRRIFFTSSW